MISASPSGSRSAPGAQHQPWLKFAALVLVVAALGLPVNDLFRYGLLVIAAVVVVAGTISRRRTRWIGALAAVVLCVLAQVGLEAPRIEEGHNVFLVDGAGGALETSLPSAAFHFMAAEFNAQYPPARRCDPAREGCWRGQAFPRQPFAFSADGIYDRATLSRRVSGIDFSDPVWLRLGFINEHGYNWNSEVSDVTRASRERNSLALIHRWRLEMPWFVMYRFPAAFVGSALCWRGEVLWEGADERFEPIAHAAMQCRTLTPDDVGRRIFGVAIAQPLAMRLAPSATIRVRQLVEPGLALIGTAMVLALLVRVRARRLLPPLALVAITLTVAFFNDASFLGGVRPFDSGDDGLVYDGYARVMLRQFLAGDITGALEGSEAVFYFTPGLRYLRAVEHLIFGESYLGYLSLILLLPFLAFAMFRRFLPLRWALALTLVFAAVPIGVVFGSSLVQYVKWAARGFADPAAYVFFLAGFVLLVGRAVAGPRNRFASAAGAGLLFALALFVRPNIAPAAGVLLAGAGLAALWQRQFLPRRRAVPRFSSGARHGLAQLGLRRRAGSVHGDGRAPGPAGDAARGLSCRARRTRASRCRGRASDARAAADRRLALRAVRSSRDGTVPCRRDRRLGAHGAMATGGAVAAPDCRCDAGAASCRVVLRQRRPLLLLDVAADAPGGGGLGAR